MTNCERCGSPKEAKRSGSRLCGPCNQLDGHRASRGREERLDDIEALLRTIASKQPAHTQPTGDFFPESGHCPLYVPPPLDGEPMPPGFRERFAPHLR